MLEQDKLIFKNILDFFCCDLFSGLLVMLHTEESVRVDFSLDSKVG